MISGAAGDDAVLFFLLAQLTDLIICSPQLKTPGLLKIFRLQIEFALAGQFCRPDEICLSRHIFQDKCSVIYLIECKHSFLLPPSFLIIFLFVTFFYIIPQTPHICCSKFAYNLKNNTGRNTGYLIRVHRRFTDMKTKRKNSGAASSAEYTVCHHGLDPDHPTPLQAASILRSAS